MEGIVWATCVFDAGDGDGLAGVAVYGSRQCKNWHAGELLDAASVPKIMLVQQESRCLEHWS